MTWSCRSRAIRSRSSSTASRCWSARAFMSSIATVACLEGDDRGGHCGQDGVRLTPDEGPDADDDRHVHEGDEDHHRSEQQRAVDHEVDVEQVIPEHGDPDSDRIRPKDTMESVWMTSSHPGMASVPQVLLNEKTRAVA